MAKDRLKSVKIGGIACCVPEATVETDSFYPQMGKEEVEKFKKTTGIRRRHIGYASPAVTASDLCCAAAEQLLNEKHIERDSIDAVLFVTQSADYATPSTACLLQARLGLSQECLAFDINLGCSGYVVALHTAAAYQQSGYCCLPAKRHHTMPDMTKRGCSLAKRGARHCWNMKKTRKICFLCSGPSGKGSAILSPLMEASAMGSAVRSSKKTRMELNFFL